MSSICKSPQSRQPLLPIMSLVLLALSSLLCAADATVLWKEGFEQDDFWTRWHSEGGIWAVGEPKLGPEKPYSGARCAATLLDGDYPPSISTRLVRERVFVVPAASLNPRLRLWQWFRGGPGGWRAVEVKSGLGDWQALQVISGWNSDTWVRTTFDLRPFAGQAVQLAFHFQSNGETNTGPGWYLDDVSVEANHYAATLPDAPEGFENGFSDWTVENGIWQAGAPSTGPQASWSGTNCASAVLSTNLSRADSRLVSPEFVIVATNQRALLTFQQWYDLASSIGSVEVREADSAWQPLGSAPTGSSAGWVAAQYDVTAFVGKLIQVGFRIQSNDDSPTDASWFVDQVQIQLQAVTLPSPPPSVRIERINAEMITLCPDSPEDSGSYILEACDDLNRESDPSRWIELMTVEPGSCATIYSSLSEFRFFRLRSAGR
jgi:hypothetical protein